MRGKEEMLRRNYAFEGITPAYAGKSESGSRWFKMKRDPPRLCGEKFVFGDTVLCSLRITPAYAGKSTKIIVFIDTI